MPTERQQFIESLLECQQSNADDYRSTGKRKNSLFADSYSMIEKILSGPGAQIPGVVLSATGFQRFATEQSATAIKGT